MQPPVDGEQDDARGSRKYDKSEGQRHDPVHVVQTDGIHQQETDAALGGEHLGQQGPDDGQ